MTTARNNPPDMSVPINVFFFVLVSVNSYPLYVVWT